jgi:hypothetical protein
MSSDARPLVPARLVVGMVALVLGVLFLAESADLLNADSALAFWPVGLVALGLVVVLQPDPANRLVGAVLMTAGVWLLLNTVGVWTYPFLRTWPYLLIVVGAWVLYRARRMRAWNGPGRAAGFAFVDRVARQVAGTTFTAGDFSAVGGSCSVDLGAVAIDQPAAGAVVDVFAVFGRIELLVPAGWRVDNRVLPLLAHVDMPTQSAAAGPLVIVRGSAICGVVSVTAAK